MRRSFEGRGVEQRVGHDEQVEEAVAVVVEDADLAGPLRDDGCEAGAGRHVDQDATVVAQHLRRQRVRGAQTGRRGVVVGHDEVLVAVAVEVHEDGARGPPRTVAAFGSGARVKVPSPSLRNRRDGAGVPW